jgi:tRNA threonylcarbamoyladenosine biosynthesis protein TsaE
VIHLEIATPEAMESLGHRIGSALRAGDLVVLVGELGAGKTTLTRGIGEAMGVRGPVTSPTFVLSRVHPPLAGGGPALVHIDGYRLSGPRELDDLDVDWDGAVAVVEWGEGLLDGIAEAWLRVAIDRPHGATVVPEDADGAAPRRLEISGVGTRGAELELVLTSVADEAGA